jgi:CPA2 family monovalent cation:H+ antiporter-2
LSNWWIVLLGLVAVIGFKAMAIGGCGYIAGMTAPSALTCAVYLANAGEFTLVVLTAAQGLGILTDAQVGIAVGVTMLSLVVTPMLTEPVHSWAGKVARVPTSPWVKSAALREPASSSTESQVGDVSTPELRTLPRHVIIAGYGPVGRAVADRLAVSGVSFTVVELNANTVQRGQLAGKRVIYGDITNHEVLEHSGVHWSDAIVLAIPDDEAVLRAIRAIREVSPGIFIAARSNFLSGKFRAMELGANVVTVSEVATAVAMEREFLDGVLEHVRSRAGASAPAVRSDAEVQAESPQN